MYSYTTSDEYHKYFRSFPNKYPVLPYQSHQIELTECHWGQLKLLYSEIEFLTIVSKYISLKECLIVYVGAAPGTHDPLLLDMFPDSNWFLIDPAKFNIRESDRVKILNGFFTDDTIKDTFKIANGRKIIFICDMRSGTTEKPVWENMLSQQKWAIQLNAEFIMLKFRLAYTSEETKNMNFDYDLGDIKDKVIITNEKKNKESQLYLRGKIFIQIFQPVHSTETRLITSKIKYINNKLKKPFENRDFEKYIFKYYNYRKYEEQLNYFNLKDRLLKYEYKESKLVGKYLLGHDDSYSNVGSYYILYKYFKNYLKEEPKIETIIKIMYKIDKFMINEIKHKTTILCTIDKNLTNMIHHKNDKKKINSDRIKKFTNLLYTVKQSYEEQLKNLKSLINKQEQIKLHDKKSVQFKNHKLIFIKNDKIIIDKKTLNELTKFLN